MVKIENSISGKSLSLYVDNKSKVNKLMINLIEAGFTVNYEPRYISGNYEGCFLCEDGNVIKICCRKPCQITKKQKEPVIWDLLHRQLQLILPHCYF